MLYSLLTTAFVAVVYFGFFFLFVKKLDRESFKGKKILRWFFIVGAVEVAATFVFTFLKGNYLLFGVLMPYINFFVLCDVLMQKTYDCLNYLFIVVTIIVLLVTDSFKEDMVTYAIAAVFIVLGYIGLYGVSDGYLLAVITLLLVGCGCSVLFFPFVLFLLSTFYSVVCVHLPVYVCKRVKKENVKFWKMRNAFGPAIYLAFITVMVLDIFIITL